jgi:hypothetical protein
MLKLIYNNTKMLKKFWIPTITIQWHLKFQLCYGLLFINRQFFPCWNFLPSRWLFIQKVIVPCEIGVSNVFFYYYYFLFVYNLLYKIRVFSKYNKIDSIIYWTLFTVKHNNKYFNSLTHISVCITECIGYTIFCYMFSVHRTIFRQYIKHLTLLNWAYIWIHMVLWTETCSKDCITNTLSDAHRYASEWIDIFVVVFDGK